MEFLEFKNKLFDFAKKEGIDKFEIYSSNEENLEIVPFEGTVDSYNVNTSGGVSFKALMDGKVGYAYSEILDEESIEMLVLKAKENALLIENEDEEFIFKGADEYPDIDEFDVNLSKVEPNTIMDMVLKLEKKISNYTKEVDIKASECAIILSKTGVKIANSEGVNLSREKNRAFMYGQSAIKYGDEYKTGLAFKGSNKIEDFNLDELAKRAYDTAKAQKDAKPIESGKYRIIFSNEVMASFLSTFSGIFSSENAQKGLSLLEGKEGNTIAGESVNLVDNPLLKNAPGTTPFDDEGVPTSKKYLIQNGEFKTLLYNLKTANKKGIKSTGNGVKSNFNSSVKVEPWNLCLENGKNTFRELLVEVKNGVYITEVGGMHAGANAVTGDFSLVASGNVVRNGEICEGVNQITISGNFYDLLKDIELIADDMTFGFGNTASPSVVIKELSIAGK